MGANDSLHNPSNKLVRLDEVSTSCGCTTTAAPSVLPPHGTVPLTGRYDSAGRVGAIKQSVILRSGTNTLVVPVTGTVVRNYRVSASEIALETGKTAAFTVSRRDGKPIILSRIEAPQSVAATVAPLATNAVRVSLRRVVSPGAMPGDFLINAPAAWGSFGSSYDYNTPLALKHKLFGNDVRMNGKLVENTKLTVLGDVGGEWHTGGSEIEDQVTNSLATTKPPKRRATPLTISRAVSRLTNTPFGGIMESVCAARTTL